MPALLYVLLLWVIPGMLAAEDEPQRFNFRGDRSTTVLGEGSERTRLIGNARIETDGVLITADQIEVFGESFRYAEASGNLRVIDADREIELTAQTFFYDRELEISRAEGAVYMEDARNEVVVRAGFLESYAKEDVVMMQVGVRIFREDMTARAEVVRFLREEEIIELSGLPMVFWKGDEYSAARIQMDLEKDEIVLQGGVQGTVKADSAEEDGQPAEDEPAGDAPPEEAGLPAAEDGQAGEVPPAEDAPLSPSEPLPPSEPAGDEVIQEGTGV